jgi:hypothetical protein
VWTASAQRSDPRSDARAAEVFKTATFNVYIGAELTPVVLIDPSDPDYLAKVVAAVTEVYV